MLKKAEKPKSTKMNCIS